MDIDLIRNDFPVLHQTIRGKSLAYLDNAATTQKPQSMIEAMQSYYQYDNSNVHRGVHALSARATDKFEKVREQVRQFINAESQAEIIFTRGTTESINLIAQSFGRLQVQAGDEVLISMMEHHSNIVPWQVLCESVGAILRVIPITKKGDIDLVAYEAMLSEKTKLVAVVHVSNTLGTVNPVKKMLASAKEKNIATLVDAAQSAPHFSLDVQDLDCDFLVFSAHKLYGPTGVGVLYGKKVLLDAMPPYQTGGNMISVVSFEKTTYAELPAKFEGGTPNIAGVVGLGAALDYIENIGLANIEKYENELLSYATSQLGTVSGLKIIGNSDNKASVVSFVLDGIHPHDVGTILDMEGIAVRTGHHCTQPLMEFYQVPSTTRASFSFYNTMEEVDRLKQGLLKVKKVMGL